MFAHCKGPIWNSDDFSRCFQHDYLQTLLPLIASGISVLFLVYQIQRAASARRASTTQPEYSPLLKRNGGSHGYGTHGRGVLHESDDELEHDEDETDEEDTATARDDEEIDFIDQLDRTSGLKVSKAPPRDANAVLDRPRGELLIALVEEIAVLAALGIQVAALLLQAWGRKGHTAALAGVSVWAYIALLTSLRLLFSASASLSLPRVWYHTAFLYCLEWLCVVLLFRSEIIHPRSALSQRLTIAHFSVTTLLCIIALTSRRGNRAVVLEYEGDMVPSREPLASVFSLATFSWVDPIVWTGYRKVYELSDVWNLIPRDKAANVLAHYRQVKKTNRLAWHLLKHFRHAFLLQSFYSAITGFITFMPTLLLQRILRYVEDSASTPRSAAWFYVILLFVTGILNALANGQALWIGRKICIQLRAIIIGEIYAKALRRRAAASSDKILGFEGNSSSSDDPNAKPSLWRKILCLGRSKSKKDQQAPSAGPLDAADDEGQVSSGAIINLMAVDSFKVSEISAYLHFLWAQTPVEFVLAIVLLYQILGVSSMVGIGMMAFLLPLNMYIARRFSRIQKDILAATDARINTTNEVLTNIRIIKYFAWEQRFLAVVDEKRAAELRFIRDRYIVWAFAATIWSGAPVVIALLTFAIYTFVEQKALVPSVAFTALSLFNLLRVPLDQLADMVAHCQESKVSVDRVEEYLNEPETDKYEQLKQTGYDRHGETLIGFKAGTFSWGSGNEDDFKMIDLNMDFKVGQLNIIVGPTGSGKTSMLMALLGEMTLLAGSVYLPGARSREGLKADPRTGLVESVAYCAQQAWLVNGTIKENIVFAGKWDATRYKQVIIACSLERDLEILDGGDQTVVGEKGVTLSGGQKQRISLARALYCNARHVLMDDVLSAVDAHTAKWIFEKALAGPLMENRTCILVTHNAVLCLPHAEFAVVLDNGRVAVQGTAEDVINSGKLAEDASKFESRPESRSPSDPPSRAPSGSSQGAHSSDEQDSSTDVDSADVHSPKGKSNAEPSAEVLTKVVSKDVSGIKKDVDPDAQKETKSTGAVKWSTIYMYFSYMGGPIYWILTALCFALHPVAQVATNVWVREWANAFTRQDALSVADVQQYSPITHLSGGVSSSIGCLRSGSCFTSLPYQTFSTQNLTASAVDEPYAEVDNAYYLGIFGLISLSFCLITLIREGILFGGSLVASKRVHRQLMESVSRAKFRFFDSTPLGQIMNRFSKDIESVDQETAPVAIGMVHCLFSIVTIIVLVSVITPGFLIAAVFISILYFLIGAFYINSSRDLKRLESIQRSPLYQQFGETLTGMTTIRAYGDENRFIRENLSRINTHSRPFIYLWAANRWLALRVDVVGALVSFFSGAFIIMSEGSVDAGAAGLAMTYAVSFTENVLWFVRLYSSNEQNMNSVERIKEYLDVDQEAALIVPENRPDASWPSKGAVEFINYSTRYRADFDRVLRNLSFKIAPGEKVGVVGRTGAGKSSMALALFRALEAEEGQILVDDVDIGTIGLQDLRENVVMVPQDPTLFTGTIRSNLDPFSLFTDEEVFTALRRVQLVGSTVTNTASGSPSRPATPVPASASNPSLLKSALTAAAATATPSSPTSDTSPITASTATLLENKNPFRSLSSPVAESGSNLSQGQRQLLCLARAMLKAPKVLLMDEATASIDYATDAKIQETIREIRNTTITIAHRLQTIIDYDKVLVLDRGEVVEWGDPWDLIREETLEVVDPGTLADSSDASAGRHGRKVKGVFKSMCQMSGDFDVLKREAESAWKARNAPSS